MSAPKFFETTITVRILSEEPYIYESLSQLAYDVDEGPAVGQTTSSESVEIDGPKAAALLTEFHSDPGFFSLDANGVSINNPDEPILTD